MRGPTQYQLDLFDQVDDEQLRRFSVRFLDWSFVIGTLNLVGYFVGLISVDSLIAVTLFLSYMAIWLTLGQTVVVTDVKKTVDE